MAKVLRIAAVFALGLAASACTPCGDWSKFNSFPGACHSSEAK
ncbi:hypothetical protein SAMN06265338_101686 [Rhodoblastus acidophilus]|uniref:Lipoprotein n=1 Tax=Rhodoblastus acidophilus TaxID=1074 RepID=A0A212QKF0_RHOAC|nr:hypothetical protein [Rhodoblastus acidophilus]MCW2317549.1 hypothetical protein [Rhodoblastus acidophilus]SNB59852.1 hypothetical protein SAMN06265338_101686 [Rhodoblastus acidophilus]